MLQRRSYAEELTAGTLICEFCKGDRGCGGYSERLKCSKILEAARLQGWDLNLGRLVARPSAWLPQVNRENHGHSQEL